MGFFGFSSLDSLEDFLVSFLHRNAYVGQALLLILEEAGIPIPIPGDIIIAYTGYQIARGTISYPVAFGVIMLSVLIGASILYFISYHYGQKIVLRFGKFIHIDQQRLLVVERQFKKYGPLVIIFGRHIPGFRVIITIFSGISKIRYRTFIVSTFISSIFWIAFYLEVGKQLGPRTIRLLRAHHIYYFLFGGLLIAFIVYILFAHFKIYRHIRKRIHSSKNR